MRSFKKNCRKFKKVNATKSTKKMSIQRRRPRHYSYKVARVFIALNLVVKPSLLKFFNFLRGERFGCFGKQGRVFVKGGFEPLPP